MSTILYLLALASPWFLDMPVVVSNLLCAVATFGTSELLNHVILLRRELYVPCETTWDVSQCDCPETNSCVFSDPMT